MFRGCIICRCFSSAVRFTCISLQYGHVCACFGCCGRCVGWFLSMCAVSVFGGVLFVTCCYFAFPSSICLLFRILEFLPCCLFLRCMFMRFLFILLFITCSFLLLFPLFLVPILSMYFFFLFVFCASICLIL